MLMGKTPVISRRKFTLDARITLQGPQNVNVCIVQFFYNNSAGVFCLYLLQSTLIPNLKGLFVIMKYLTLNLNFLTEPFYMGV